jgi:hypothetical protein
MQLRTLGEAVPGRPGAAVRTLPREHAGRARPAREPQ